jgi:hypothetical protein
MVQFYKPNPRNSGSACSFYKTRDGAIMFSIIKQASWDESRKTGSFQKNKTDPKGNVKVKLSLAEAAGILETVDKDVEFKEYHNSQNQSIQIRFAPYVDKNTNERKGFSLSVNKTGKDSQEKLSFIIGLTFKEARLLREYMVYIIHDLFANPIKQNSEPESSGEESPAETSVSAPVPTPAPKQAQQSITDDIDF